eukprot:942560-Amphidinium_carterae.1
MKIYQMLAPSWMDAIRHHSSVHLCSAAASEDAGDLKQRFLFSSPMQCSLHRVAHDHFGLSNAKLLPGTVVMGVLLKETWVTDEARSVRNGFVECISVDELPIKESGLKIASFA